MKSLAQVISDEGECLRWESCFLHNLEVFDYVVIGCIGDIGPNLLSLQDRGAHLVELAPRMTDFNVLHNGLLDHIFNNPQFDDATTFIMVDSDETVEGVPPIWDSLRYPMGANLLYDYQYPFMNTRWISDRAFMGRTKPTVLGEYHFHYSSLGDCHLTEMFYMRHHRNYHGRKYNVFGEIDYNLYESKMSWIQCVVEAYCGGAVITDVERAMIVKSYDLIQTVTVPAHIGGSYYELYQFNYLWMRWNLEHTLGHIDQALQTAEVLEALGQRVGILLQWVTRGHLYQEEYYNRYLRHGVNKVQYGDVIDSYRSWHTNQRK